MRNGTKINLAPREDIMKLYFIPFACSLATRIAINEAELDADFVQVTPGATLPDGRDFASISRWAMCPRWRPAR
jgi:glutathione S-transferase